MPVTSRSRVRSGAESTIGTGELRRRLDDPELTIVDVRSLTAFNGWRLRGEARGGHVPGAVVFPRAWFDILDGDDVESLLSAKGVHPDREIVLYGDDADDVQAVGGAPLRARPFARADVQAPLGRLGGFRAPSGRAPAELRQAGPPGMASTGARGWPTGGASRSAIPALPRQLRGSGGVRGRSHPGGVLPRHQLARESRRLEPPLARRAERGRERARHHEGHDGRPLRA